MLVSFSKPSYLAATVIAVPLAKRWGLGSVLGYLLAGVIIGPHVLALVGQEGGDIMHFAEFGVVMMLFLVGLELEPSLLWRLRGPVLGMGGAQVGMSSLVVASIAWSLGLPAKESLAIGMILALSSTAIALQTLSEKGLLKTRGGQSAFSILLFQDIAVIPMLALLPLLATRHGSGDEHTEVSWLSGMPAWAQTLVVVVLLAGIVAGGRFLMTPVFRYIAKARLRETFTAASLLLVIGIALLMTKVGLSPALGTFVAGVVLATSEYKHELEAEIEPFKGLLLGLFFIAVGASIDFSLVARQPILILGLVVGLIVVKFVILVVLARVFGLSLDQNMLLSFSLAQGGEFCFVLFSFATQNGVLQGRVAAPLVASVALSMALTPLLIIFNEKLILPRFGTKREEQRPEDEVREEQPVIVAGSGRFGQITARLLRSAGFEPTLLDFDSDQVDLVRKFGARVYFGDATRMDLLRSAGAEQAKLLVVALDQSEKALELVHSVKKHFPHLKIVARARDRGSAFDLIEAGVDHVIRETFDSSISAGREALELLGVHPYQAGRLTRAFRRHDERLLRDSAASRKEQDWIAIASRGVRNLENVLRAEYGHKDTTADAAWDPSDSASSERRKQDFKRDPGSG